MGRQSEHGVPSCSIHSERNGVAFVLLRSHLFILLLVFVATLPLINPLVHGDGVGYYAYLRAPVIQHNLRFEEDWRRANPGFVEAQLSPDNQLTCGSVYQHGLYRQFVHVGPRNSVVSVLPAGARRGVDREFTRRSYSS